MAGSVHTYVAQNPTPSAKQTTLLQTVARATGEQASATEQVATSMRAMRTRTREIATAVAERVKAATTSAGDITLIAHEIAAVRRANAEQANELASLVVSLGDGNGVIAEGSLESS